MQLFGVLHKWQPTQKLAKLILKAFANTTKIIFICESLY